MTGFWKTVTGTDFPVEGAENKTIIAAQGAGTVIRVQKVFIGVTLAGTGNTSHVALEDGLNGTKFVDINADAVGSHTIDFGEVGFPLTANTLLNATSDQAGTNQASARVTVVARVAV